MLRVTIRGASQFSREDGSLLWRKAIDNVTGERQILKVNEQLNLLIVAGEHQDKIYIRRYDTDSNFIDSWNKDLAIFTGSFGTGFEPLHAMYLVDPEKPINILIIKEIVQITGAYFDQRCYNRIHFLGRTAQNYAYQ